jgi:hypothetical protein
MQAVLVFCTDYRRRPERVGIKRVYRSEQSEAISQAWGSLRSYLVLWDFFGIVTQNKPYHHRYFLLNRGYLFQTDKMIR